MSVNRLYRDLLGGYENFAEQFPDAPPLPGAHCGGSSALEVRFGREGVAGESLSTQRQLHQAGKGTGFPCR